MNQQEIKAEMNRYKERIEWERNTVQLIGVGRKAAKPASEFNPGDVRLFNYGTKIEVINVEHKGNWTTITTAADGANQEYSQRYKSTTLVPFDA